MVTVLLSKGGIHLSAFLAVSCKPDLFLVLWSIFLSLCDWAITNTGAFSTLCTVFRSLAQGLCQSKDLLSAGREIHHRFLLCLVHVLTYRETEGGAELQRVPGEKSRSR